MTSDRPAAGRFRLGRFSVQPGLAVAAGGLLLPLALFLAIAAYDLHLERDRARERVMTTTEALAGHAGVVMRLAGVVLSSVLAYARERSWEELGSSPETQRFLAGIKSEVPQLESVFLVDPNAVNVASSRRFPLPRIEVRDRDYFQAAAGGNQGTYVSEPFRGQLDQTFSFTVTKPLWRDGRFDGLAGVTISSPYFEAFYRAISDHPNHSVAALLRDDGVLLVRFPERTLRPIHAQPSSPLLAALAHGADAGLYESRSSTDGHLRLTGYRRLRDAGLVVSYSSDRTIYLQDWYTDLGFFGVLSAMLAAAIAVCGVLLLRKARQAETALAQLVAETDRRQAAEAALLQSQKLEALGRLTGGIAHDFNNLLTAILGSLELLARHVAEGRPARYVANARSAAERGAQLTKRMLAFARREAIVLQPVDLNEAVRGMESLLRGAVGPMVTLRFELEEGLPASLADRVQMEAALLNLAVNAHDAMPGGGTLTIVTARAEGAAAPPPPLGAGAFVRLSVRDSGVGMTEAVRQRAFEPFFTTKGPGRGTGLGLSMVFGFASHSGGTATVESAPGAGTVVHLFLPVAPVGVAEATGAGADGAALPPGLRTLLVDDDPGVRMTTRALCEELGLVVREAESGAAALASLEREGDVDLAVIDFAMPDMNGAEVATRLRARHPGVKLLFVTGYVEKDGLRAWEGAGVVTLAKPFTRAELASAVQAALAGGRVAAQVEE